VDPSNRERAAKATQEIKLAMMDEGETKFTSVDIGGLGSEEWHSPYLLLRAELFETREEVIEALGVKDEAQEGDKWSWEA